MPSHDFYKRLEVAAKDHDMTAEQQATFELLAGSTDGQGAQNMAGQYPLTLDQEGQFIKPPDSRLPHLLDKRHFLLQFPEEARPELDAVLASMDTPGAEKVAAKRQAIIAQAAKPQPAKRHGSRERNSIQNVVARLKHLKQQGQSYTSWAKLGEQLDCCAATIGNAIKSDGELKAWQAAVDATRNSLPDVVSIGREPAAVDVSPDEQAAINELSDNPQLMDETLQKLRAQAERNYSGAELKKQLTILDQISQLNDPARCIVLYQDQLRDDRQQLNSGNRR